MSGRLTRMNGKFARMKKLAAITAIVAAMAFGLVACGKPSDGQKQGTDEPQTQGLVTSPITDEDQSEGQGLDQEQPDQQAIDGDEDGQPIGDDQSSDGDQANVEGQPDEEDQDASTAGQSAMEEQSEGTEQPDDTKQAAAENQPSDDEEASTPRPLTEEEKASGEYEELIPGVWVKKTDVEEEPPLSDDEQPSVNGLSTPEEFMAAGYVEIKPGLWAPRESAIELGYITEDDKAEGTDAGAEAVPPETNDNPSGTESAGGNDAGTVAVEQQAPESNGPADPNSQEWQDAMAEFDALLRQQGVNVGDPTTGDNGIIDPNAPNIVLH